MVALESIAREWDVANEKLSRRLRLARGTRPLPAVAALRPQGSYTRDALAANHRRAALAVEQVLTPAQRTAACDMERASGPRDRALTRASGARHTSTRPLWPWCGATTPARTLAAVTGGAD